VVAGPFDLTERIRNLSAVGLASLMRRLLQLEAARLNLPLGSTRASQRVTVGDEGEDGVALRVPEGVETRLPIGDSLLQFKTTQDNSTVIREIVGEITEKKRPQDMLASGGHYIAVWSKDAVGKERDALLKAMKDAVGEDYADRVHVWSIGEIEELCNLNTAILIEFNMVPGLGVLTFANWAVGQVREISNYIPDEQRLAHIDQIQKALLEDPDPVALHLQGDAGVGKSRLLREALDAEDIRDLVVVGTGTQAVEGFIRYVISNPATHCILVADEIDPTDLDYLRKQILPAEGRISLITAGLPPADRGTVPSGKYDIELSTLDQEALLELVTEEVGLPEDRARWVSENSKGYPRLAIEVANAIKGNASVMTLGAAITSQDIYQVLDRMIPEELQKQLGVISLFSQVGVEGNREHEIKAVGAEFGVDHAVLTDTLEGEVGRFVSRAGSLRSVTPKLVSVFLAQRFSGPRARRLRSGSSLSRRLFPTDSKISWLTYGTRQRSRPS
jgi:hypothetical protein